MIETIKRVFNRWMATMVAKKKWCYLRLDPDLGLRERIEHTVITESQRWAVFKDCHLIEAALATDSIVISLDDTVRGILKRAARSVIELRPIAWANPDKAEDDAIPWLERGAEPERERLLGFREVD